MSDAQIGERIRQRLLELGYRRDDGEPNVREFAFDFRFDKGHVHAWITNKFKPFKELARLSDALKCSPYWLMTGREQDIAKKATPPRRRPRIKNLLLALAVAVGGALMPSPSKPGMPRLTYLTASALSEVRRRWSCPRLPYGMITA